MATSVISGSFRLCWAWFGAPPNFRSFICPWPQRRHPIRLNTVQLFGARKDLFLRYCKCRIIIQRSFPRQSLLPLDVYDSVFCLHRGQHHVGSMVALLAVEVASVARVTCPVLGREFASSFFWIQELGHRWMSGCFLTFFVCFDDLPVVIYCQVMGARIGRNLCSSLRKQDRNFQKLVEVSWNASRKPEWLIVEGTDFFPGNFNWFLFGFFLMSHRLSFACQMGDMLHALICRTDHDDSWKKAWELFSQDMNMYTTYRCQGYLCLGRVRSYLLQYLHISCFEVFQRTVWNLHIKVIFANCPLKLMHFPDIFCFDDSSASIWKLVWFATGVHWKCFCPEALLLSLPDVGENWWLSWYVGGVFSRIPEWSIDVWGFPKKKSWCSCKLHPFQFRWQEEE